ncbi:MAG TPA: metallophosphoesterase [Bacteroidales bacterium]|nr:metallophosphoesterase [Bacteroidales bacterium]
MKVKMSSYLKKIQCLFFAAIILSFAACEKTEKDERIFPQAKEVINQNDSATLHFFVLSDWGFSGANAQIPVANQMAEMSKYLGIDFILTCGDNFQVAGVTSTGDPLWQSNFVNIYSDSALLVPWYPALGNHDYMGNPEAEVAYSSSSKYWQMLSRYYTFVKKIDHATSARFIVLDTPDLISSYQKLTNKANYSTIVQFAWLKTLLSYAQEKWIFVTGHHPVYSASTYHGDTEELKVMLKPLFDTYHVDFYISGHDHHFEHTKDIAQHTEYIVTGTGGAPREAWYNSRTIFAMSKAGLTYVSVLPDTAKLYFIISNGELGYSFTMK